MQHAPTRAILLGLVLGSMLASCSRRGAPTAPVSGPVVEPLEAGWNDGGIPPQTARARLRFVGSVVELRADLSPHARKHVSFYVDASGVMVPTAFLDTIPSDAKLEQVRWRKPDGTGFVIDNDPSYTVDGAVFGPDAPLAGGPQVLVLRVPEKAGGGPPLPAWVHVGFPPGAWWAGPDPALFPPSSDGDGRAVDVLDWATFRTSPAWPPDHRGYIGPDSFANVPSRRAPMNGDFDRRTFYEIWGDRIYARSEGDAVHRGAWVVFSLGGYDRDSPYVPKVTALSPGLPPSYQSQPDLYSVLIAQGLIGSPSQFRHWVPVRSAGGAVSVPPETIAYPNFDAASVYYQPTVAGYWRADHPGKAYAVAYAVDSDGRVGRGLQNGLLDLVDRVDAGLGSAADRLARRHVLTFTVRASGPAPQRLAGDLR